MTHRQSALLWGRRRYQLPAAAGSPDSAASSSGVQRCSNTKAVRFLGTS